MATFVILSHPVTTLVTALTNPDNLTNDCNLGKVPLVTYVLGQDANSLCYSDY